MSIHFSLNLRCWDFPTALQFVVIRRWKMLQLALDLSVLSWIHGWRYDVLCWEQSIQYAWFIIWLQPQTNMSVYHTKCCWLFNLINVMTSLLSLDHTPKDPLCAIKEVIKVAVHLWREKASSIHVTHNSLMEANICPTVQWMIFK